MHTNTSTDRIAEVFANSEGYANNNATDSVENDKDEYKKNNSRKSSDVYRFPSKTKKAKWSPEAKKFLDEAEDSSLVLNVIISLSCKSQTGEAFEELVNSLNEEPVLSKIKKINILDTTYLYRHFVPEFSHYNSVSIPTEWYQANRKSIEKLKAKVELQNWATEIDSDEYRKAFQQVMKDFGGDENGKGLITEFRDTVIAEAATNAYKHKQDRKACIDFILEECAHLLASFKSGGIIVYPMKLYSAGDYMIANHNLNIRHLSYKVDKDETDAERDHNKKCNYNNVDFLDRKIPNSNLTAYEVEAAVTNFMKNEVSNLNFFVVSKTGKLIYSNFALNKLIDKEQNADQIDENAWIRTYEVIRSGKMLIGEELGRKGRIYLSMKAPLWVKSEIQGAIGLSIDVTDTKKVTAEKKRAMDLEFLSRIQQLKLKFHEEFAYFISQTVQDISFPLSRLEIFAKSCKGISKEQEDTLGKIASNIRNISTKLLEQYENSQKVLETSKSSCTLVALSLFELLNQKKLQYKKSDTKINLFYDPSIKYSFININQSEFESIVASLIDMAVRNCEKADRPMINVRFNEKDSKAILEILDNGPDNGSVLDFGNQKEIRDILQVYDATLNFTRDSEGNKSVITFSFTKKPEWIATQIDLHKGGVVAVFDNDWNASKQWEKLLEKYLDDVKLKVLNSEEESTIKYIESLSEAEKDNICVLINYDSTYSDSEDILNVVMRHDLIRQSIIMTSAYKDSRLREVIAASGAKILPKQFLKGMSVVLK